MDVVLHDVLDRVRRRFGLDIVWVSTSDGGSVILEVASDDLHEWSVAPWHSIRVPIVIDDNPVGLLCARVSPASAGVGAVSSLDTGLAGVADAIGPVVATVAAGRERLELTRRRVGHAIDAEQLTVLLQSVYAVADGAMVSVEALARFTDLRPPDVWFDEARQVALGAEMELAAIRTALDLLAAVPPPVRVAVNVSPDIVIDPRLTALLEPTIAHRVVVELTEHEACRDDQGLIDAIAALRARGVAIAIDDIGTGVANWAQLLRLRPDVVKIDMSLIRHCSTDRCKQQVIRAIVMIAHEINATTVAEGVETASELRTVAALGVANAQGYLLGRPTTPPLDTTSTLCTDLIPDRVRRQIADLDAEWTLTHRFDVVFHHAPIGMAVINLDGHFQTVNSAMAHLLGRPVLELEAMTCQELTHPDDLDTDLDLFQRCLDGNLASYRTVKRYLGPDGAPVVADLTVSLVRDRTGLAQYFLAQVVPMA